MKSKDKQIRYLKDARNGWIIAAIVFFSMFIIYSVLSDIKIDDLKQQLSEDHEQGPICDFKNGHWGFRVVCKDDFFGWKNSGRIIDQHFHGSLESCEEGLKFYVSYKNCEVLE